MSTFRFTIINSGTALVEKDGFANYKSRYMTSTVTGDTVLFQDPINVGYDFSLTASDVITAEEVPVTGTASEIATYLMENIFNSEPSFIRSDEAVVLTAGSLSVAKDQPTTTDILIENYNEADASTRLGLYCNNSGLDIRAYDNSGIVEMWVSYGNSFNLKATGAPISFDAPSFKFTVAGIPAYADDAAAAAGGVPVNGIYRTASALKIRVA
jgi:hypothetical protein